MKFLILMSLLCVALATPTTDNQKTIKSFNDKEIRETVCSSTVRREDFETIVTKLQKCLRQKRQEKLTSRVVRRSIDDNKTHKQHQQQQQPQMENMIDTIKNRFNIDKLLETFKSVVEQKDQHQGKLNIVFGITQMTDEDEDIINDETTTTTTRQEEKKQIKSLKCEMKQTIKILSARMTTKKYEETCNVNTMQTVEALKDLNEQCDDTTNTMVKVIQKCENKNECELNIETDLTGVCECTQNKYLDVTYTCLSEQEGKSRSKRALHYRNRPLEIERERLLRRQIALAQGLDYILDNFNYQLLYGGYGYGGYGYGYGLPLYG